MRQCVLWLAVFCAAASASGQVLYRPSEPPQQNAASEAWYLQRAPISIAGGTYYPSGPAVFFNGHQMVPSGQYNGVPLYADPTVEPYTVFLVPIGRGLMQPYRRQAPGASIGMAGVQAGPEARPAALNQPWPVEPVGTAGTIVPPPEPRPLVTVRRPDTNDGIWIRYQGDRWVSRGAAVPLDERAFTRVGEYAGFPIYARRGESGVIYLPTREGVVAPYGRR